MDWREARLGIAVTSNHDVLQKDFMVNLLGMLKPKETLIMQQGAHIKSASLNRHVEAAYDNGCTHILFLDVDMLFPKVTIPRLLSHGQPIVSGLYHLKVQPFSPVAGWFDKDGKAVNGDGKPWKLNYCPLPEGQLVEVDWCGIGCLMVDMDVFNKIYFPCFKDLWNDEEGVRRRGHDVIFCDAAREAGYKIYVDTVVDCIHQGRVYVDKLFVKSWYRAKMDSVMRRTLEDMAGEAAHWDSIWSEKRSTRTFRANQSVLLPHLLKMIPKGVSVADVGCGDGALIELLQRLGGNKVFGYDLSSEAVAYLRDRNIASEVLDLRKPHEPSRRFHTVICSHVLEHLTPSDTPQAVKTLADLSEKQLIIIAPDSENPEKLHFEHRQSITEEYLRGLLSPYLSRIEVLRVHYTNPERNAFHLILRGKKKNAKSNRSEKWQ